MPEPSAFESFLREYTRAAKSNPILGLKDNLINLIRREDGDLRRHLGGGQLRLSSR